MMGNIQLPRIGLFEKVMKDNKETNNYLRDLQRQKKKKKKKKYLEIHKKKKKKKKKKIPITFFQLIYIYMLCICCNFCDHLPVWRLN